MPELSVVQPQAPAIARCVEEHLDSCRGRGLSPKTVKLAYGYPLRESFLPWCARQGLTEASHPSTRLLERYPAELLERGGARGPLTKDTARTYVKAVRGFLAWLKTEGDQVEAEARLPKLGRRVIEVLERAAPRGHRRGRARQADRSLGGHRTPGRRARAAARTGPDGA